MPHVRHALLLVVCFTVGCDRLTDPAVDLAKCVANGADRVPQNVGASEDVMCHVRSGHSVTAILSSVDSWNAPLADSTIRRLENSGVPRDALYYSGPDQKSVGHPVPLGQISVYDGNYPDNRRYSTSSAVGANVRVSVIEAKTADEFVLHLSRAPDGKLEVLGFR